MADYYVLTSWPALLKTAATAALIGPPSNWRSEKRRPDFFWVRSLSGRYASESSLLQFGKLAGTFMFLLTAVLLTGSWHFVEQKNNRTKPPGSDKPFEVLLGNHR
jgi:hypothetical protein